MVITTIRTQTLWGGSSTWVNGQLTQATHYHPYSGTTYTWDFTDEVGQAPAQASVVTGVDPSEIHNALYGKPIPLSVLGRARIGTAGLIYGPYFSGADASRAVSFGVSFGFPANVTGTRRVYEIALDSKVAWENADGSPAGALGAGFISPAFTCRFYSGTQTQGADPLESAMFGAQAVAYRPQMMLWFENLPVAPFDGKVPFVSCIIGDVTDGAVPVDGINLGEALERVAYSPWLEYDNTDFETTGVADIVQAMILTEDQSFMDLLRVTNRVYRTLDIIQTDKLRVRDRGATVTPDIVLRRDNISVDAGVTYTRQEEVGVPRELELTTIDPDADYVLMVSKASRQLSPVPVTASVGKETITLPVVIDANTRASLVTYTKYEEENARKRISLQTMLSGYALEPGDLFKVQDIANGFDNSEVYRVVESSHGANYINEIIGEAILKCAFEEIVYDVILLLHGEALIDSSIYDEDVAFLGGAHIDTTEKKFGAASFSFDGTSDRVDAGGSLAVAPQYDFSPTDTSPYTIELWARFVNMLRDQNQMLICRSSFAQRGWVLYNPADSQELVYATSSNTASYTGTTSTAGAGLDAGVWQHIAVDKDSTGKVRIYVDGVMRGSSTPADSVIASSITYPITVGADAAGLHGFLGHIDEVRITKASRYGDIYGNASFPVPGAAFPDSE